MMFTENFIENFKMQIFHLEQTFNDPLVFIFISTTFIS